MKRFLFFSLLIFFGTSCKKVVITEPPVVKPPVVTEDTTALKSYNKDISVVNWNIEWFGLKNNGSIGFKGNLDVQEANAGKILKYLGADIYGICEVVDTARFGRMIRNSLGEEFRYVVSNYPTILNAQKLAFIYNRNIFRNVSTRPFLGLSSNANNYFAQRFPFLLTADVVVNGQRNIVNFILIHAKANADLDSYNRRLNGSAEMKDSLDKYFGTKNVMVIGDYNDNFNGSILAGKITPYQNFLNDSLHFNAITLPLNTTGYQSTITYSNSVIDQQVINTGMNKWYVSSSVKIRTDITIPVPDYNTANTSDHYPVSSVYRF